MPGDNEPQMVSIDAAVLRRLQNYAWRLYGEIIQPETLHYLSYIDPCNIYNDIRLAHVALGEVKLCECCGHPTGNKDRSLMGDDFTSALQSLPKDMPLAEKVRAVVKNKPWGFFR